VEKFGTLQSVINTESTSAWISTK